MPGNPAFNEIEASIFILPGINKYTAANTNTSNKTRMINIFFIVFLSLLGIDKNR